MLKLTSKILSTLLKVNAYESMLLFIESSETLNVYETS